MLLSNYPGEFEHTIEIREDGRFQGETPRFTTVNRKSPRMRGTDSDTTKIVHQQQNPTQILQKIQTIWDLRQNQKFRERSNSQLMRKQSKNPPALEGGDSYRKVAHGLLLKYDCQRKGRKSCES